MQRNDGLAAFTLFIGIAVGIVLGTALTSCNENLGCAKRCEAAGLVFYEKERGGACKCVPKSSVVSEPMAR